jgi:adenine-specific DNA glycosylase
MSLRYGAGSVTTLARAVCIARRRRFSSSEAVGFPATHAEILALPGIGRSTAAAICVFAFGGSEAILDGNVKRLFARRFAIPGYPGNPDVAAALWREAEAVPAVIRH